MACRDPSENRGSEVGGVGKSWQHRDLPAVVRSLGFAAGMRGYRSNEWRREIQSQFILKAHADVVWKEILRSPKCSLGDQLGTCDDIAAEK